MNHQDAIQRLTKKVIVMKYFSVMANGKKWTKQEVTIDDLEARGFKVQPSRLYGDFDVFHGVQRVATLFKTQAEAMQHIA